MKSFELGLGFFGGSFGPEKHIKTLYIDYNSHKINPL